MTDRIRLDDLTTAQQPPAATTGALMTTDTLHTRSECTGAGAGALAVAAFLLDGWPETTGFAIAALLLAVWSWRDYQAAARQADAELALDDAVLAEEYRRIAEAGL